MRRAKTSASSVGCAQFPRTTATSGYAYTAREWDPEINLYYYRARYYDPKVGRFISEDPAKCSAGTNFYTYLGGNPVTRIDPSGLPARFFLEARLLP
jgi:RHS repeat-associated protein